MSISFLAPYRQYVREIAYLVGDDKKKTPLLLLLFIMNSFLDLIGIGLIGPYIALVINPNLVKTGFLNSLLTSLNLHHDHVPLVMILGLGLIVVFLIKVFVGTGIHYLITYYGLQLDLRLRSFLMQAYQNLPYSEYLTRNSSEYLNVIINLTPRFAFGVFTVLLKFCSEAIVALFILSFLAVTHGTALALLIGLFGGIIFCYDRLFRKKIRNHGKRQYELGSEMVKAIHEGVEGLKEIRILGKEKYFHNAVYKRVKEAAKYTLGYSVITVVPGFLLELGLIVFIVIIISVTLFLGKNSQALFPILGTFGVAALRLRPIFLSASTGLSQLRFNRDAISALYKDIRQLELFEQMTKPQIQKPVTTESFRSLILEDVNFSYQNTNQQALQKISIEVHAGESIGLIGPSGAGKTTLMDVLLGLLFPQEGQIRYNGKLLNESYAEWHSQIAYLPQQIFLIDNTLKRNVALGIADEEIDNEKLHQALQRAQLKEVVDQLPQGVDTFLGERGIRLSGGQRQRVALARAFYHERNILVMDEATSAIDNETELEIVSEIRKLKGKKTVIVIAHRLTTVQHCDRIYRLNQGQIVECGTSEILLP